MAGLTNISTVHGYGIDESEKRHIDGELIYRGISIPADLHTPLFAMARIVGWCAHRIEEVQTGKRIIRSAYKSMNRRQPYLPIEDRR